MAETLTIELNFVFPDNLLATTNDEFEGEKVTLGLNKA
jgi:hypothetical protein